MSLNTFGTNGSVIGEISKLGHDFKINTTYSIQRKIKTCNPSPETDSRRVYLDHYFFHKPFIHVITPPHRPGMPLVISLSTRNFPKYSPILSALSNPVTNPTYPSGLTTANAPTSASTPSSECALWLTSS